MKTVLHNKDNAIGIDMLLGVCRKALRFSNLRSLKFILKAKKSRNYEGLKSVNLLSQPTKGEQHENSPSQSR